MDLDGMLQAGVKAWHDLLKQGYTTTDISRHLRYTSAPFITCAWSACDPHTFATTPLDTGFRSGGSAPAVRDAARRQDTTHIY
jgi:hypothetical protein